MRSGGAWGTSGTPTSLREHRAHHVRMCAPEHTSARCAHLCTFQGITTHWKPVVPLRSGAVRVLCPVYLLCSNTSADISYEFTFFLGLHLIIVYAQKCKSFVLHLETQTGQANNSSVNYFKQTNIIPSLINAHLWLFWSANRI